MVLAAVVDLPPAPAPASVADGDRASARFAGAAVARVDGLASTGSPLALQVLLGLGLVGTGTGLRRLGRSRRRPSR